MDITPGHERLEVASSQQSPATQPRSDRAVRPRARLRHLGRNALVAAAVIAAGAGIARWQHVWPFKAPVLVASAPPVVPVTLAKVKTQAVPIWLTGLGTVQAYNTVTIRARVDGQLVRVAYTEGQDVKQGDLLVEIDPHPYEAQLASAQAKFAQDTATLKDAQLNQQRYVNLVAKQDVAKSTLDTQEATVLADQALVQADQAAIVYAGVQLAYTKIMAPISGRTGVRLVDEGNIVHAADGGGLVVITQLQPISLVFSLPQDSLGKVQAAMRASKGPLQVQAFGRDPLKPLAIGKLDLINNQVNQQTGTVDLKASFANEDNALWPGQFVTGQVQLSVRQDGITVPDSAVQRGPNGTFVFTVGPDNKAKLQPVDVALTRNGMALIDKGVKPGDTVITQGQFKVKPDVVVRNASPEDAEKHDGGAQATETDAKK